MRLPLVDPVGTLSPRRALGGPAYLSGADPLRGVRLMVLCSGRFRRYACVSLYR
jgi:hypothetical protein